MGTNKAQGAIVGPRHPFVSDLVEHLGVEIVRVDPDRFDAASLGAGTRVVWIHMVPTNADASGLDEAELFLRSQRLARRIAAESDRSLTFLALLPSRGLYTGPTGLACELARGSFEALMRAEIDEWGLTGNRIVGVVYPALDGYVFSGQRSAAEALGRTPMAVLATVDHIADAIRFLGSERTSYLTGTLVHVDGGWNAYSWFYPARAI
jgi:hypothetical protein